MTFFTTPGIQSRMIPVLEQGDTVTFVLNGRRYSGLICGISAIIPPLGPVYIIRVEIGIIPGYPFECVCVPHTCVATYQKS